jgi:hypothetical protein
MVIDVKVVAELWEESRRSCGKVVRAWVEFEGSEGKGDCWNSLENRCRFDWWKVGTNTDELAETIRSSKLNEVIWIHWDELADKTTEFDWELTDDTAKFHQILIEKLKKIYEKLSEKFDQTSSQTWACFFL